MGRICTEQLSGPVYCCRCCGTHLAKANTLLSKQFHSKNGPAWLFSEVTNVVAGPPEPRLMTTGVHVVADCSCVRCLKVVGWKYEEAYEESQKYKEGKFILERAHMTEAARGGQADATGTARGGGRHADEVDIDAVYF